MTTVSESIGARGKKRPTACVDFLMVTAVAVVIGTWLKKKGTLSWRAVKCDDSSGGIGMASRRVVGSHTRKE
jgi:hypothetical protein